MRSVGGEGFGFFSGRIEAAFVITLSGQISSQPVSALKHCSLQELSHSINNGSKYRAFYEQKPGKDKSLSSEIKTSYEQGHLSGITEKMQRPEEVHINLYCI